MGTWVGWERAIEHDPWLVDHVNANALAPASPAIGRWIGDHPDWVHAIIDPDHAYTPDEIATKALQDAPAPGEPADDAHMAVHLAAIQRQYLIQIAVRDLIGHAAMPAVGHQLADLAQGLIQATLTWLDNPGGLAVIGMGKLGGRELNYISDVDVVFVHDGNAQAADLTAKRVLQILGGHTPLGAVYEMDAGLRPEGRNGPLTRPLESWQHYWKRWAKTWEAQAFLKARHVAGNTEIGEALIAAGVSMVWPAQLGTDRLSEIRQMKTQVEHSPPVQRDGDAQLKLAPGGLRDIEFTVQLLQLIHGTVTPSLRVPGTLEALDALAREGLVSTEDATKAMYSYQALRTVEHRLQLYAGRRTHTVPMDDQTRGSIAYACGFRSDMTATALTHFDQHLARVRREARAMYHHLFLMPLLDVVADYSLEDALAAVGKLNSRAVVDRLHVLGFSNPKSAVKNLNALFKIRGRLARPLRLVAPLLLNALATTGDPDAGLGALRTLIETSGQHPVVQQIITDNPPAATMLVTALGQSPRIGPHLQHQPELLTLLEYPDQVAKVHTANDFAKQTAHFKDRPLDAQLINGIRRLFLRQRLRIMLRSLTNGAEVCDTNAELSDLADALMDLAVALVCPPNVRLGIIALGRWGARELAFGSDLDAMIIYDGDAEAAAQAVERLLRLNEGFIDQEGTFKLDLDLRPGGRSGAITLTSHGTIQWLHEWAEPWQLQALTLARPAAGDLHLAQATIDGWADLVFPRDVPEQTVMAIRTMKARVEAERGQTGLQVDRRLGQFSQSHLFTRSVRLGVSPAPQQSFSNGATLRHDTGLGSGLSLKTAPGGLSDVEWCTQLAAIRYGASNPELRVPSTLGRLVAMRDASIMQDVDYVFARDGWIWLSRIRNALWLMQVSDTNTLPRTPATLAHLAAVLQEHDVEGGQAVTERTDRARRRIRKVFDTVFWS
ncbi:hypothetical protein [Stomatohabitans albus]|uniref:[protein-PII] uridylyltransferase family protein n=1 Tax=Stomatohabitans albus TaxID=3110766 RepID=UPI00300DA2F0